MVAFAGPSGSGKTTKIDLILMILKPQKVEVLIDGISGEEINLTSWRKQIGYVTQDGVIFNAAILNNIAGIKLNVSDKETLKKSEALQNKQIMWILLKTCLKVLKLMLGKWGGVGYL